MRSSSAVCSVVGVLALASCVSGGGSEAGPEEGERPGSGGTRSGAAGSTNAAGAGGSAPQAGGAEAGSSGTTRGAGGGSGTPRGSGGNAPGAGRPAGGGGGQPSGAGGSSPSSPPANNIPGPPVSDPAGLLPARPVGGKPMFCGDGSKKADRIRSVFCGATAPAIKGMADFLNAVKLDPNAANIDVALAAHSTSLTARSTSPINPRVFVFDHPTVDNLQNGDHVVVAFVRGEPLIEIAAIDANGPGVTRPWNFYLARIDKPCGATGCAPADLLSDKFDVDWNGVALYSEGELRNTTVDCSHCHTPSPSARFHNKNELIVLFPENRTPWTHWFSKATAPGKQYFADFERMLGGRTSYGPIPKSKIDATDPEGLWNLVYLTFTEPDQVRSYAPTSGKSAWTPMWNDYLAGNQHAPPNYDAVITDPMLTAAGADLLARHAKGEVADKDLTDVRNVFAAGKLVEIGHLADAQATGEKTAVMACGQCHNSAVPKALTRAAFDAKTPASWNTDVKKLVRERLSADVTDPKHMPPVRYTTLSDSAKEQLLKLFAE